MDWYIAARYARQQEMRAFAEDLKALDQRVVSTWVFGEHDAAEGDRTSWTRFAIEDACQIHDCDGFILFPGFADQPRGGHLVELGLAYGYDRRVFIIGPKENIFCYLPGVWCYETKEEFLRYLKNGC